MSIIEAFNVTLSEIFPAICKSNVEFETPFWLFPTVKPLVIFPDVFSPSNGLNGIFCWLVVKLYNWVSVAVFGTIKFLLKTEYFLVKNS